MKGSLFVPGSLGSPKSHLVPDCYVHNIPPFVVLLGWGGGVEVEPWIAWVQIPAGPLVSCVTLDTLLHLSVPRFPGVWVEQWRVHSTVSLGVGVSWAGQEGDFTEDPQGPCLIWEPYFRLSS